MLGQMCLYNDSETFLGVWQSAVVAAAVGIRDRGIGETTEQGQHTLQRNSGPQTEGAHFDHLTCSQ